MKNRVYKYINFLLLLIALTGCSTANRFAPREPDPFPVVCMPKKVRVALVLGGGGVRGMAHVGVLQVLEEEGIPIDLIVGCSAGSIVGALYSYNPCVEDIKCAVMQVRTHSLLDIDIWHCRWGLSQGKSMNKILKGFLGNTCFDELQIPFISVATDLNSGELVPLASGDVATAVQASASIPFVFVPVEIGGRILVDGGTINPVPVRVARDLKPDIIIAVDLCELLDKTFPSNLFQVANRSAEIAFMWQNESCTHHADVIIRPKTRGIGTFNDKAKMVLYEAGRDAALQQVPLIKELMSKHCMDKCEEIRSVYLKTYPPGINCDVNNIAEYSGSRSFCSSPVPIIEKDFEPYIQLDYNDQSH